MKKESSFGRADLYARVTNVIVAAIEAGVGDYRMPWHQRSAGLPQNITTRTPYRGVNTIALWAASQLYGYTSPFWATYRQWSAQGAQVRRGEKATSIVFFKRRAGEGPSEHDQDRTRQRVLIRGSCVFNAEQVDGWREPDADRGDKTVRLDAVDGFVKSVGAEIRYGSDVAAYSPRSDRILMPERRRFVGTETSTATESFYSVLLHEHIHWTGHKKRLGRDLSGRFGERAYAMEELIAELGAAFLCAELGISLEPRRDHAVYVRSWLSALREQKSAIVRTSGLATAACRYLGELAEEKECAA